jgi:eukaryotic-like serine/threonine-protein kinase
VSPSGQVVVASGKRSWAPWALAGVLGAALLGVAAAWLLKAPVKVEAVRFQIEPPDEFSGHFAVSPNGRYLAMAAQRKLWIREMGSLQAKVVDGVDDPTHLFWSPDSSSIGFSSQEKLKRVTLAGARVQTLCDVRRMRGAAWSKGGVIVFSSRTGIERVSAEGGTPVQVTRLVVERNDSHRFPVFLPDDQHFLFTYQSGKPEVAGIYIGSIEGTAPVRILPDVANAIYVRSLKVSGRGYLLVRRGSTVMAQPFDTNALHAAGEIFPVAEDVSTGPNRTFAAFSASATGVLAFQSGWQRSEELTWVDRAGRRIGTLSERGNFSAFALSPDERHVAFGRRALEKATLQDDIWLQDSSKPPASRFTYGPEPGWSYPLWSPDGKDLVYSTTNMFGVAAYEIRRKAANMVGTNDMLLRAEGLTAAWDISPDGKWLLYEGGGLKLLPLSGRDRKSVPVSPVQVGGQSFGQFSPDGLWIAYGAGQAGRTDVYVEPFPATGAKWQISVEGGNAPRWRRDGRELFFHSTDGRIMAAAVKTAAGSLEHGAPQALFPLVVNELYYRYQPSRDGQRFLVLLPAAGEKPAPINVVLNWEYER